MKLTPSKITNTCKSVNEYIEGTGYIISPLSQTFKTSYNVMYENSVIAADHGRLFYLVYEKVKVNKDNMEPHLWTYRQRISLEHLRQTLTLEEKCPVLHEFLRVVSWILFILSVNTSVYACICCPIKFLSYTYY